MGISKIDLFTEEQNEIAIYAKAFSHPARVAILQYLINKNECINSDLVKELGLAQATVSQHLRELKDIGLIQGNIEGNRKCYCINPIKWEIMRSRFSDIFELFKSKLNINCC